MPGDLPEFPPPELHGNSCLIGFADPFSFPVGEMLAEADERSAHGRRVPVIGGMASAGNAPGENRLILDGDAADSGFAGVLLSGDLRVETAHTHGCRPFGEPLTVSEGLHNVVITLEGRPALEVMQEASRELPAEERGLLKQGVFLGRLPAAGGNSTPRDVLVANIIGIDPNNGAIVLNAPVCTGDQVQFHLRDAAAGDAAFRDALAQMGPQSGRDPAAAGLLINCTGRGATMWPGTPNHDAALVREVCADVPVAGMFAAGEFAAPTGRSVVLGLSAVLTMFRPLDAFEPLDAVESGEVSLPSITPESIDVSVGDD
jgi:small ligand-binding sensory domain FIST